MDIEIDTPEWFDLYVARPVEWLMRTDFPYVPNVWYFVVLPMIALIFVGSIIHRRRVNRRYAKRRALVEGDSVGNRTHDDESYSPFANKFTVPGDDI